MMQRRNLILILLCFFTMNIIPVFILQERLKLVKKLFGYRVERKKVDDDIKNITNLCFVDPSKLEAKLFINFNQLKSQYLTLSRQITNMSPKRQPHTQFVPNQCKPVLTVAVIIPARDRNSHVHILLGHLHPFLQKQLLRYQFYVVHQVGNFTFNKGRLMNTAFKYALEDGERSGHPYDCFIFHDVDLLPESELNFYRCGQPTQQKPKPPVHHLAHTIEKYAYKTMCCGITVGGVLAFTKDQYQTVNGYSNEYWGWGGEDDDMNERITQNGFEIYRMFNNILSRYLMIRHIKDQLNPVNSKRYSLMSKTKLNFKDDGLKTLTTNITSVTYFPLYVNISVDVGVPDLQKP